MGYADDRDIAMFSAGQPAEARQARRPAPPHQGHRAVRVEGLHLDRRAPAADRPADGHDRQLEQPAGAGLGRGRRQLVLRLLAPRAAAERRPRAPAEARPRVGHLGDERGGDAGPAQRRSSCRPSPTLLAGAPAPSPRAARMFALLARLVRHGLEPARPRPRRADGRRPRARDHGRAVPEALRRRPRAGARQPARGAQGLRGRRPAARAPASPAAGSGTSTRTCAACSGRSSATRSRPGSAARGRTARRSCGRRSRRPATTSRPSRARTRTPGSPTPTPSGSSSQPGLLPTTIRYTNRPSGIQQVIEFTGHRKR